MFVVPSTLQVLLVIVLVLLGLCGNLVVPFVSYRTTLRGPHITVLAALDFTATLLGPGLTLVTLVIGPTWLEHNKPLCLSLSFLSSSLLITCVLVLFVLAVFCQKVQHDIYPDGRRRAKIRQFVFLAVCLLSGLLMCVPPLLGWSSYNGLSFLHSCSLLDHVQDLSNYSVAYLAVSFIVLSSTTFLAIRAIKRRQFYRMQLLWERHVLETKINDPEMTTAGSSAFSDSGTSVGKSSRASSFSNRRSGLISACNSPMAIRKSQQRSASLQGTITLNVLLDKLTRQSELMSAQQTGRGSSRSEEPEVQTSVTSSVPWNNTSSNPFVISSRVPYTYQKRKNIFKSARCLPRFQFPQQQRSLSRLLSLRCCVTLLCLLPLYVTVVLRLASVNYPQELHVFIQWLIFIQTSISSLLPLCDPRYRQVWRRTACSCFKACAEENGTHADLSKSCDVESRIEGILQVRLRGVTTLDASRL